MAGDVVRVNDSPISQPSVLNEVTDRCGHLFRLQPVQRIPIMTTSSDKRQLAITTATDDEIDLRQVAGALGRRWPWIAGGRYWPSALWLQPAHHEASVSG